MTAEQVSSRIFYIITGLSAIIFLLFRLIGYDTPYEENYDYNAPLLTGTLVGYIVIMTLAAATLMVWGMARSLKRNGNENRVVNNIPAQRIKAYVTGGFLAILVITFAFSDSAPISVNGTSYTDALWLRIAGMFVGSSIILIVVAAAVVAYGAIRNIRKKQ